MRAGCVCEPIGDGDGSAQPRFWTLVFLDHQVIFLEKLLPPESLANRWHTVTQVNGFMNISHYYGDLRLIPLARRFDVLTTNIIPDLLAGIHIYTIA